MSQINAIELIPKAAHVIINLDMCKKALKKINLSICPSSGCIIKDNGKWCARLFTGGGHI
jgi:hypothetical protein